MLQLLTDQSLPGPFGLMMNDVALTLHDSLVKIEVKYENRDENSAIYGESSLFRVALSDCPTGLSDQTRSLVVNRN